MLLEGYDPFNALTAAATLTSLEEEIVTDAPDSSDASATANPIPRYLSRFLPGFDDIRAGSSPNDQNVLVGKLIIFLGSHFESLV